MHLAESLLLSLMCCLQDSELRVEADTLITTMVDVPECLDMASVDHALCWSIKTTEAIVKTQWRQMHSTDVATKTQECVFFLLVACCLGRCKQNAGSLCSLNSGQNVVGSVEATAG